MAIKGISDKRRLPRLGKIKLGAKKKNAKGVEYPSATDYFVCPNEVEAVFGKKPRALRVMFPTEDNELWASQWLKCYSATRGLICKGDGETATAMVDQKTGEIASKDSQVVEMRDVPCDPDSCPMYEAKQCRRVMSLQFLLPEVPGLGVWQLDTTSYHSIVNINSALDLIRGIYGRVSMIPLTLSLVPQGVQAEGKKKTVHVLALTSRHSILELQAASQKPKEIAGPVVGEESKPSPKVELPDADEEMPEELFSGQTGSEVPVEDKNWWPEFAALCEQRGWNLSKKEGQTAMMEWCREHFSCTWPEMTTECQIKAVTLMQEQEDEITASIEK